MFMDWTSSDFDCLKLFPKQHSVANTCRTLTLCCWSHIEVLKWAPENVCKSYMNTTPLYIRFHTWAGGMAQWFLLLLQRVEFSVAFLVGSQLTVTLAGGSDPLFWCLWAPTHKWHEQIHACMHACLHTDTHFFKKKILIWEKNRLYLFFCIWFIFLHMIISDSTHFSADDIISLSIWLNRTPFCVHGVWYLNL